MVIAQKDQIEQMKLRRPEKYKQQILGAWLNKAEGVIFDNWTIGEFKRSSVSAVSYTHLTLPTTPYV